MQIQSGHNPNDSGTGRARGMRVLPALAACLIAAAAVMLGACSDEKKSILPGKIDPEKFPTMRTVNVSTLISDSGITRYKITSPLWLMYEESRVPQWKFPKGLHLEKYDDFFRKDATVDCDRATYFKDKLLWRLDGYVRIANIANEKFLTPQLYWDQRHQRIYSDSFIHIEKADRIIEGYGFESNEKLTDYKVRNVSGIFPVSAMHGGGNDSTQTTTVVTGTPMSPTPYHMSGGNDSTRRSRQRPVPQQGPVMPHVQSAPAVTGPPKGAGAVRKQVPDKPAPMPPAARNRMPSPPVRR